jgi:hypothetical protein
VGRIIGGQPPNWSRKSRVPGRLLAQRMAIDSKVYLQQL